MRRLCIVVFIMTRTYMWPQKIIFISSRGYLNLESNRSFWRYSRSARRRPAVIMLFYFRIRFFLICSFRTLWGVYPSHHSFALDFHHLFFTVHRNHPLFNFDLYELRQVIAVILRFRSGHRCLLLYACKLRWSAGCQCCGIRRNRVPTTPSAGKPRLHPWA